MSSIKSFWEFPKTKDVKLIVTSVLASAFAFKICDTLFFNKTPPITDYYYVDFFLKLLLVIFFLCMIVFVLLVIVPIIAATLELLKR